MTGYTGDEREALDYAIRCAIPADLDYRPLWKVIRAIQDAVIAAGFHRSEMAPPVGTLADENERLRTAIQSALDFQSVLPAIATTPRRILVDALTEGTAQ